MADSGEKREEPWNQPADDPQSSVNDSETTKADDKHVQSEDTRNTSSNNNTEKSHTDDANKSSEMEKPQSYDSDDFENSDDNKISYSDNESDLIESILKKETGSNANLLNHLLGCAYGQALGDAYGLSTEFEDRDIVNQNYPNRSELIPFPDYILTYHNRRWKRGDWTDDTDQWILIFETLTESEGDVTLFAKKLTNWIKRGFSILGDHGGMGLGANVSQVVHSNGYLQDPLAASEAVWERSGRQAAPNGAVMRCSAVAFVHFNDLEKLKTTTELMCKTTHFDPRCIASCLAVCLTIAYLLRNEGGDDIEALIKRVQDETIDILGNSFSKEDRDSFLWHTDEARTLDDLNLDESRSIGYTYKCLGSGFYGLRSTRSFAETLNDLIRYGGDADTNGAVCGTMYGARHGYKALPHDWLRATPFKKWFDKKIIEYLKQMKIIPHSKIANIDE
ncbi:hypothetical protein I4U23_018991 [Adineta vaga]|nr:hypothetical protein I4U23_018991 [Adineta vaga]